MQLWHIQQPVLALLTVESFALKLMFPLKTLLILQIQEVKMEICNSSNLVE